MQKKMCQRGLSRQDISTCIAADPRLITGKYSAEARPLSIDPQFLFDQKKDDRNVMRSRSQRHNLKLTKIITAER